MTYPIWELKKARASFGLLKVDGEVLLPLEPSHDTIDNLQREFQSWQPNDWIQTISSHQGIHRTMLNCLIESTQVLEVRDQQYLTVYLQPKEYQGNLRLTVVSYEVEKVPTGLKTHARD